jgi:hypothetical protein
MNQAENSPKLFLIKNAEGKWYNEKDEYWSTKMSLATYTLNFKKATDLIDYYSLENAIVFQTTELEFTQDLASITTSAIIQLASIKQQLEELKYRLPTISAVNKNLGTFLGKTIDQLKVIDPMYNEFIKQKPDQTDDVEGYFKEFISEISGVELYECRNVTRMIKQYRKNPKSIMGIVSKYE